MKNIYLLFSSLKKIIFESDSCVIYKLKNRKELGRIDPEVKVYSEFRDVPQFIVKKLFDFPIINSLFYRIKSHKAKLLCIYDANTLIAYGWIQNWKPFKQKFGWLTKNGTMLGPYWTHPQYRGKGYYGRLLKHSIAVSNEDLPLVIYTSPENMNSQKGIEKIEFEKIGNFRIDFYFRHWVQYKKIK